MRRWMWLLGLGACATSDDTADTDSDVDTDVTDTTDDDDNDDDDDDDDDETDDTDVAAPGLADVLDCGALGEAGGLGPGTELQRVDLDPARFPDAVCNDGTPGFFYFRPAATEEAQDRWVIQLQGGGECTSPETCFARWCSVDTAFGKQAMTNTLSPQQSIGGKGILARREDNPLGDFNHVFIRYCSSDAWAGDAAPVATGPHPTTGEEVSAQIHFRGRAILAAVVATLQQDDVVPLTYTLGGDDAALPDLDEAESLVLAGGSAGGLGTLNNADWLGEHLRLTNDGLTSYGAIIDSAFPPSFADLDLSATETCTVLGKCDYEAWMTLAYDEIDGFVGRVHEDSCVDAHPTDTWQCADERHLLDHHVTTPFLLRMGQSDELIAAMFVDSDLRLDGDPLTFIDFAKLVRQDAVALANASDAEEFEAMERPPAVFMPTCRDHETLSNDDQIFDVTIDVDGTDYTMFDVFEQWRVDDTPRIAIALTLDDNVCP